MGLGVRAENGPSEAQLWKPIHIHTRANLEEETGWRSLARVRRGITTVAELWRSTGWGAALQGLRSCRASVKMKEGLTMTNRAEGTKVRRVDGVMSWRVERTTGRRADGVATTKWAEGVTMVKWNENETVEGSESGGVLVEESRNPVSSHSDWVDLATKPLSKETSMEARDSNTVTKLKTRERRRTLFMMEEERRRRRAEPPPASRETKECSCLVICVWELFKTIYYLICITVNQFFSNLKP